MRIQRGAAGAGARTGGFRAAGGRGAWRSRDALDPAPALAEQSCAPGGGNSNSPNNNNNNNAAISSSVSLEDGASPLPPG